MGLRDLDSIDFLMAPPPFETEDCKLILMIVDATADLSDDERHGLLLKKLAGYLSYIAAPDFSKKHPGVTPADVIARVLTVMPPTTAMLQIDAIRSRDSSVRLRVVFDDYHAFMAKVRAIGGPRSSPN